MAAVFLSCSICRSTFIKSKKGTKSPDSGKTLELLSFGKIKRWLLERKWQENSLFPRFLSKDGSDVIDRLAEAKS